MLATDADFSHRGIIITLTGIGQCCWSAGGTGDDRRTYHDTKQYCNLKVSFGENRFVEMVAGRQVRHRISFQLPRDLPSSLRSDSIPTMSRGHVVIDDWTLNDITYTLTAVAVLGDSIFKTSNPITHLLTVHGSVVVHPQMMAPSSHLHGGDLWNRCFCLASSYCSTLSINVQVDRTAFVANETITVAVNIASEWTEMVSRLLEVNAMLVLSLTQHVSSTSIYHTKLVLVTASVEQPRGASFQALLKVPRKTVPSFAGNGSDPLTWTYHIVVEAKVAVDTCTPGCCAVQTCTSEPMPITIVSTRAMEAYDGEIHTGPVPMSMARADHQSLVMAIAEVVRPIPIGVVASMEHDASGRVDGYAAVETIAHSEIVLMEE